MAGRDGSITSPPFSFSKDQPAGWLLRNAQCVLVMPASPLGRLGGAGYMRVAQPLKSAAAALV
jgi:hypothetical protein